MLPFATKKDTHPTYVLISPNITGTCLTHLKKALCSIRREIFASFTRRLLELARPTMQLVEYFPTTPTHVHANLMNSGNTDTLATSTCTYDLAIDQYLVDTHTLKLAELDCFPSLAGCWRRSTSLDDLLSRRNTRTRTRFFVLLEARVEPLVTPLAFFSWYRLQGVLHVYIADLV
jgi:hypothetical protein